MTDLISMLKAGPVRVRFIKADKTERVMLATLNQEYFTTISYSKYKPAPGKNLTVWDIEKDGWRIINQETVIEYA